MSDPKFGNGYLDDLPSGGGLGGFGDFGPGAGYDGFYRRGNPGAVREAQEKTFRRERREFQPAEQYFICASCHKIEPTEKFRCASCGDLNAARPCPQHLAEAHVRFMSQPLRRRSEDLDEEDDEFGPDSEEDEEDDDDEDEDEEEAPPPPIRVRRLSSVKELKVQYISTGDEVLDEVWCGGAPTEHCLALSAPPGTGKSTLLRRAAGAMSKDLTVMYVSGEESEGKIKGEFRRTVFKLFPHARRNVLIASANNPESIVAEAHKLEVDVLIIDSLSHLQSHKVQGAMGKEVQMKHAAEILMDAAHGINTSAGMKPMIVIVIVHATKGLDMAGANAVKHVIDGAFFMEHIDPMTLQPVDDQNVTTGYIRIRAHGKYRAGDTNRVGYYRMTDKGLKAYHPKKPVVGAKGAKKGAARAPNPSDRAVTKKGHSTQRRRRPDL